MAAISGSLHVRLEKIGYHVLGNEYENPQGFHINKAVIIVSFSSLLVIVGILIIGN